MDAITAKHSERDQRWENTWVAPSNLRVGIDSVARVYGDQYQSVCLEGRKL